MKVLFILDSLGTGGSERSTADLWYFLRQEKVEVNIAVLRHRSEGIESEILAQNFNVYFLKSTGVVRQSREIIKHIQALQPDIVHSVLFKSNLRTRIARMKLKFIHIESLVNCSYDKIRLKDPKIGLFSFYFYKYLDWISAGWVDYFHAVTEGVKVHYHRELRIAIDKIFVIHRGRSENKFNSQRLALREQYLRQFELPDNAVLIIHVGRQEYQKGHMDLLEAICKLDVDELSRCAFLFLGREGNSTLDIKSYLPKIPRSAKLIWLGHRQDVQPLLACADIFVFPSLYEGIGGALIEAQASFLPIVCRDIPVLREVVLKDMNALMHENVEQLAACLSMLIKNEPLRASMGGIGYDNFRNKFSIDKINRKMLSFYLDVVQ